MNTVQLIKEAPQLVNHFVEQGLIWFRKEHNPTQLSAEKAAQRRAAQRVCMKRLRASRKRSAARSVKSVGADHSSS